LLFLKVNKERYHRNKKIVFELYGISPQDKNYNCHHIVMRHDLGDLVPLTFDIDNISNLYPLRRDLHEQLHLRVEHDEANYKPPKRHKHKVK